MGEDRGSSEPPEPPLNPPLGCNSMLHCLLLQPLFVCGGCNVSLFCGMVLIVPFLGADLI